MQFTYEYIKGYEAALDDLRILIDDGHINPGAIHHLLLEHTKELKKRIKPGPHIVNTPQGRYRSVRIRHTPPAVVKSMVTSYI